MIFSTAGLYWNILCKYEYKFKGLRTSWIKKKLTIVDEEIMMLRIAKSCISLQPTIAGFLQACQDKHSIMGNLSSVLMTAMQGNCKCSNKYINDMLIHP